MTTNMTELNIPDAARKRATSHVLGLLRATDMTGSRKKVASDILISLDRYVAEAVAAELRRLAEEVAWSVPQIHQIHNRADELDPAGAR